MKLTFDDIKNITLGAIRYEEHDNLLYPLRCTEKQEAVWTEYLPLLGTFCKMTAGIRLDFYTDSNKMKLSLKSVEADGYDFLINGTFIKSVKGENCIFDEELPNGENRITVVFPNGSYGAIKELILDDGASVTKTTHKRKFLFFGDSITQGACAEYAYLDYVYRISDFFDADFLNQAVGGAILYAKAFDDTVEYNPDCVFTAFGTNDYFNAPTCEKLYENGKEHIQLIKKKYADKQLIALLPLWRADETPPKALGTFADCRRTLRKLYEDYEFDVIDCYDFLPKCADYYSDGSLHPNALGYSFYSQNLIKALIDKIK